MKIPQVIVRIIFKAGKKRDFRQKTPMLGPQEHVNQAPLFYAYKNSKNIDKKLGYYSLPSTKTPKIDPQEYVYQGSPPIKPIKTPKT